MPLQSPIDVTIANYNAQNQSKIGYLGLNGTSLVLKSALGDTTTWTLIPNVAPGAVTGGFALYNRSADQYAYTPTPETQIILNDDPTPYGALPYCWTFWPTTTWNGLQLWAIQDNQRGPCMDAFKSGTSDGTIVVLWPWHNGDNQQWIIQPA